MGCAVALVSVIMFLLYVNGLVLLAMGPSYRGSCVARLRIAAIEPVALGRDLPLGPVGGRDGKVNASNCVVYFTKSH